LPSASASFRLHDHMVLGAGVLGCGHRRDALLKSVGGKRWALIEPVRSSDAELPA
jgi:hypothetical protein